jgi:hypothetical protein
LKPRFHLVVDALEEFDVDEDGEGLIGAPDRLLCKTWLKIGMDQTIETY